MPHSPGSESKTSSSLTGPSPSALKALSDIIENYDLMSFSQSIQNIQSGGQYGFEVLVRGPENSGLHRADQLFGAALTYNKRDALEKTCLVVHIRNIIQSTPDLNYTVNLSPNLLFDSNIYELLVKCPRAENIKLELTEHLPVENWKPVLRKMDELRGLGYEFWLDDVGCGYFDLTLIDTVQPEVVKLCITLMNRLGSDQRFIEELKVVVDKVHQYGGKVLAEGIERESQLRVVKELGVDYAQGYFFDRPAPMKHEILVSQHVLKKLI